MSAALDIHRLAVHFGSVRSVDGVSMGVAPGQISGLIGPNGAGKTTTVNAISGLVRSTGRVRLGDLDLGDMRPEQRARAGVARTFQTPRLFGPQTVRENLAVGRDHSDRKGQSVETIAELMDLGPRLDERAERLSPYERMRTEIGRALATGPRLLLLDEPAAGLVAAEVTELLGLLRRVREASACAMLIIDHNMDLILEVCEQIWVLDFGQLIFTGTPSEVRTSKIVLDAYLGEA